ncbi:LysR substrate-binding domain-containing protein [Rugamonas sp. CCM 8940]|uniref:LysR substrate-binding domain-containing protein n=1 Tax=Rugamonas sp. CCM 8940 TaxID=2765359 RepID=UPI0018F7724E|nr:LysR substrate-binding domain-containing protein [Rugamonas sp. CCM 8940]MBJ7309329.1 LysR family transcriptional regulator [Rugamonas sp. CCM 8940]
MLDLNDLQYFVLVIDHGGFNPTARALGIPKSNLSRRIAQLEARLGVRLIVRNTRSFKATEVGQNYYTHCRAMLAAAHAAEQCVIMSSSEPAGLLRLTCPIALLKECVGLMVTQFMAEYPRVEIHLEASNRSVDVVAEGVDIALRVRVPPFQDSDLITRELSQRVQRLVASPELLKRFGAPESPEDLARFPSAHHGRVMRDYSWTLLHEDGGSHTVAHRPSLVVNDLPMLRLAALRGVGVVQLPSAQVHFDLAQRQLVEVLPGWAPKTEVIHAVLPTRRGMLPATRLLLDFLAERFRLLDDPFHGPR